MKINLWDYLGKPLIGLFLVFIIGTVGYKLQNWDHWSWLNCSYMTIVTLTTVGYGDVLGIDNHPGSKIYTMILMIVGMGVVVYYVSTLTAFIVEGQLKAYFAENKMLNKISRLSDHHILCGAGATGHFVVDEFCKNKQEFVVIDNNHQYVTEIKENHANILCIEGDATDEDILIKANVKQAKGVVAMLSSDKDNLFLVVTAKALNDKLKIAARAIDPGFMKKLKSVGADIIVSPNAIGGLRLASEILRPRVVSFLDKMIRDKSATTRFGEVTVPVDSGLIGVTFGKSQIGPKTGLLIIAVDMPETGECVYNPPASMLVKAGAILIVIGTNEQINKLQKLVYSSKL